MGFLNDLAIGPIIQDSFGDKPPISDERIVKDVQAGTSTARDQIPVESSGCGGRKPALGARNQPGKHEWLRAYPHEPKTALPGKTCSFWDTAKERKEIQEVQKRHSALSEKVNHFKEEFNKLKERFPENGQQFERHISNWKLSASHLYGMKVNQLNNCRNSIHGITEVNLPNTDLDEI
ncbi:hypothetical protein PCASD_10523 [Puccinia coronata f. sp. avenae]|uniref:Uncharacterized protein n=1 Tax=Puccinia coronata f. sp. avenae TaxID=200324 RepID=A0A2N5TC38_9BASI|nr:hypothetical protein PCASD_10523 [Puccinia coronata f. sp. avenae]